MDETDIAACALIRQLGRQLGVGPAGKIWIQFTGIHIRQRRTVDYGLRIGLFQNIGNRIAAEQVRLNDLERRRLECITVYADHLVGSRCIQSQVQSE